MSLCNPCPDCYLRGTAFPAFVSSPVGPLAPSQKHSRALSNPPALGAGEAAGGGPSWAHLLFTGPPHPASPTPPPRARLASPGQHNGATSKFSLSAISFQGPAPPPSGSPSTPPWGSGRGDEVFNSRPVLRQPCGYFFLINVTFPQSTSFPHVLPTRDIPETQRGREGAGGTDKLTWDSSWGRRTPPRAASSTRDPLGARREEQGQWDGALCGGAGAGPRHLSLSAGFQPRESWRSLPTVSTKSPSPCPALASSSGERDVSLEWGWC